MKEDTKQPSSLLTHADVMEALHRCLYDPASAEASLTALERRRQSKHNAASIRGNAGEEAAVGGVAVVGDKTAGGRDGGKSGSKAEALLSAGVGINEGEGNRWEDWSEDDRSAFLTHLGDKVMVLV